MLLIQVNNKQSTCMTQIKCLIQKAEPKTDSEELKIAASKMEEPNTAASPMERWEAALNELEQRVVKEGMALGLVLHIVPRHAYPRNRHRLDGS